jgi:pyruvate dehydrogenase E2 component (dihydrolipoamide acetyltransferase)
MNSRGADTGLGSRHVVASRIQLTIARRMTASHVGVPSFSLEIDVAMDRAALWRDGRDESYNAIVVRACANALRRHPQANASWVDDGFELHDDVNIGVAVAAPGRLLVPVVRNADQKSVQEIGREIRRLASAVRDATIRAEDLAGGTFTISNLGMFGIDRFEAMINAPQAAILAVGALAERPVVRDGTVTAGLAMTLTLRCDHRVLYGADGAEFLDAVKQELQSPLRLDRPPGHGLSSTADETL